MVEWIRNDVTASIQLVSKYDNKNTATRLSKEELTRHQSDRNFFSETREMLIRTSLLHISVQL